MPHSGSGSVVRSSCPPFYYLDFLFIDQACAVYNRVNITTIITFLQMKHTVRLDSTCTSHITCASHAPFKTTFKVVFYSINSTIAALRQVTIMSPFKASGELYFWGDSAHYHASWCTPKFSVFQ